jgi:hypothetical protein
MCLTSIVLCRFGRRREGRDVFPVACKNLLFSPLEHCELIHSEASNVTNTGLSAWRPNLDFRRYSLDRAITVPEQVLLG